MRACSMSGRTMSWMNPAPVTFAGRSRRGTGLPTTRYAARGFGVAVPAISAAKSSACTKFQ